MDRDQALLEVKESWRRIYPADKKGKGIICPLCGNGAGTTGDGVVENPKKRNQLTCFKCGFSGDIIDLYGQDKGLDFNGAFTELANTLGITIDRSSEDYTRKQAPIKRNNPTVESATPTPPAEPKDYIQYYKKCVDQLKVNQDAKAYIEARGISLETACRLGIGFDAFSDPAGVGITEPRIIIPTSPSHYIGRAIRADIDKKYAKLNVKGGTPSLFNTEVFKSKQDYIFVVEGAFDALSLVELGHPAIALNSTSNTKLLLQVVDKHETAKTAYILLLDNDEAGQKVQKELLTELQKRNIKAVEGYRVPGGKDANEALINDRESLQRTLRNSINLLFRTELDNFIDFIQTDAYKPYKTGLDFIDTLFNGGMTRQSLTIVMAPPATGKTTLCVQLAETMAENKQEVIYLNLEMSREQMLAKAISYRLASKGAYYSTLDILQGYRWTKEDKQVIMQELSLYRGNIEPYISYNPAGVTGDLDNLLEYLQKLGKEYTAKGRQAPVIILDYLHLVSSRKITEAQEIVKEVVKGLKQYAIDFNTNVIAISACNRTTQDDGVIGLTSGRDSSSIEYTADYVLALNLWELEERFLKPKENRKLEALERKPKRQILLKLLKCRLSTPSEIRVFFDAEHNRFYKENSREFFTKPSYAEKD